MLRGLALPRLAANRRHPVIHWQVAQNAPAPPTSSALTIIRLFRLVIESSNARAGPPRGGNAGRFRRNVSLAPPIIELF